MNRLVVESKNDKAFVEAVIKHLNNRILTVDASVDTPICRIDDFECLGGLNERKLTTKIEDVIDDVLKRGIKKVGVLIDIDNEGTNQRLKMVSNCLSKAMEIKFGKPYDISISEANQLFDIIIDDNTSFQLACHFTNVDGKGELETVLKTIKTQESPFADCLHEWQRCLQANGKDISQKDFDKFWLSNYVRFDTCSRNDKKQSEGKCSIQNFDYVMENKSQIFDFDNNLLEDLKRFLALFNA